MKIFYIIFLILFSCSAAENTVSHSVKIKDEILTVTFDFTIPDGYKLYDDSLSLEFTTLKNAEPIEKFVVIGSKKTTGDNRYVYETDFSLMQKFKILGNPYDISGNILYQRCQKDLCLFPEEYDFSLKSTSDIPYAPHSETAPVAVKASLKLDELAKTDKNFLTTVLKKNGIGLTLLIVLLLGILTSLTPCIYPMIPITLSVIGARKTESIGKSALLSVIYVLGIAVSYTALGLAAATTGTVFGSSIMASPWALGVIAVVFLVLSLSMLDVFNIQMPASIQTLAEKTSKKGNTGIFLFGIFSGFVASPCVAPPLIAVLTLAAAVSNIILGALFLFVFAIGSGLLLIAVGTFGGMIKMLPKSGEWVNTVKKIFALLMMFASFYFAALILLPPYRGFVYAAFLFISGMILGGLGPVILAHFRNNRLKGIFASILIFSSLAYGFHTYCTNQRSHTGNFESKAFYETSTEILKKSIGSGKPVFADFGASWCTVCAQIDEETISNPDFTKLLTDFQRFKIDVDRENIKDLNLDITGVPLIVIYDSQGNMVFKHFGYISFEDLSHAVKQIH